MSKNVLSPNWQGHTGEQGTIGRKAAYAATTPVRHPQGQREQRRVLQLADLGPQLAMTTQHGLTSNWNAPAGFNHSRPFAQSCPHFWVSRATGGPWAS